MKPLQPIPQCVDCLMSLTQDLVTLTNSANPFLVEEAKEITRKIIEETGHKKASSPQIANRIFREIRQLTGISDPYRDFKLREMAQARKIFAELKPHIADNLRSRATLASIGNSLDFFNNPKQVLTELPDLFRNGLSLYFDHLDLFEAFLTTKPDKVLYLTDNAGEIYFDLPLYEYLDKHCRQMYLVVKGGPALNDLTRVELRTAELENKFDNLVDTGTGGAGIDWDNVSREFRELFASADLIVSKGMANFETIYPMPISAPSFYLFKVKCEPVQNYIQAPAGSYLALWKEATTGVKYRQ